MNHYPRPYLPTPFSTPALLSLSLSLQHFQLLLMLQSTNSVVPFPLKNHLKNLTRFLNPFFILAVPSRSRSPASISLHLYFPSRYLSPLPIMFTITLSLNIPFNSLHTSVKQTLKTLIWYVLLIRF